MTAGDPADPASAPLGRRDAIVAAAFRCIASSGIAGLRMRAVAAEAGVNIATVHYHLTNKAELIRAVVEQAHQRFAEAAATPEGTTPTARLHIHLDEVFGLLQRDPALGRVLAEVALGAAHDPVIAEIVSTGEARWRHGVEMILRPLPGRQSRPVAALVVLVVKGACLPPTDARAIAAARRALSEGMTAMAGDSAAPKG